MNTNKINWVNAILAGVTGTIAFDIVGFLFTGQWFDIARLLGEKTGLGFAYGIVGHYSNGILLAILYAGIAPSLPGLHITVMLTPFTVILTPLLEIGSKNLIV